MELTQRITPLLDPGERNIRGTELGKEGRLLRVIELSSGVDLDARKAEPIDPVVQPSLGTPAGAQGHCQGNQDQ
jgi:hypothetical protein